MESRVAELEEEVHTLRQELLELKSEFLRLRRLVLPRSESSSVLDSPVRPASASSFSVVSTREVHSELDHVLHREGLRDSRESLRDSRESRNSRCTQDSYPARASSYTPTEAASRSLSWEEREAVCDQIAAWILRCLRGEHRGASGRDQIPLASRVWVVARDFEGLIYQPVRVFRTFTAARPLVKRGTDCGDAVFIGVPSEREARRIVASAQLGWPTIEG